MPNYKTILSGIKNILKENPRGLTIQELSKEININRNSLANYLDVMLFSGHVEMRPVGVAKMYYHTYRVPMSAILNISPEYILVFNKELEIVQVNDTFLNFFNIKREAVLGKKIGDLPINLMNLQEIIPKLTNEKNKIQTIKELSIQIDNDEHYLSVKFIPTTLDDGEQGLTLLMQNITERKQMEKTLKESEERYRKLLTQSPTSTEIASATKTATDSNKDLVHRYLEIWNTGNLTSVDKIVSEDFVFHRAGGDLNGQQALKQYIFVFRTAFPDLHLTVKDIITERDKVVTHWMMTGTHKGELMGITATDKNIKVTGTSITRVAGSKVIENSTFWDRLDLMQQLGVAFK